MSFMIFTASVPNIFDTPSYRPNLLVFYVIRNDEIRHFNSYDIKCCAPLLLVAAVYADVESQCFRF
jgi:hypothetical protein